MLTRLMKYDLKKMLKFLSVFFLLALFFGLATRFFGSFENSLAFEIIKGICNGTAISMMCSLMINCFMRSWVMFRSDLFGDPSYLTHTLPVKKSTVYSAKAFTAAVSLFCGMVSVVLVLVVTYWSKELWDAIRIPLEAFGAYLDVSVWTMIVFLFFVLFIEFFNAIQLGFAGFLLGHRFNQNKILLSIIFGFVAYVLCQMITLLGMLLISVFDSEFFKVFTTSDMMSLKPETIVSIALVGSGFYVLFCFVVFFLNIRILKKGVNVD